MSKRIQTKNVVLSKNVENPTDRVCEKREGFMNRNYKETAAHKRKDTVDKYWERILREFDTYMANKQPT